MDKNQAYIRNLKIEEVPWHRITTAYGMASDFPKYFSVLSAMENMDDVKIALDEITSNIEHQSTLWHATPFAMVFLVRIFEQAADEIEKNETARFLVEKLLDFFRVIAECFHEGDAMKHAEQLPLFSDMLKEEYLWSEKYDEEEDGGFSDDLFYSFWYYSYQALLSGKAILERIGADELLKLFLKGVWMDPTDNEELTMHRPGLKYCLFCWEKVSENPYHVQRWYVPPDKSCCICEQCFKAFKDEFCWKSADGWDIEWQ